ncbi:signal peptide peptidase SppA [bacterium]|nr:signal peptide peptidase SppA [bacterium]
MPNSEDDNGNDTHTQPARHLGPLGRGLRLIAAAPYYAYGYLIARRRYDGVHVRLSGAYPEVIATSALSAFRKDRVDFASLVLRLRHVVRDERARAAVVAIHPLRIGYARAQEIARHLHAIRAADKKTAAILFGGGLPEYLLAAACGRIVMPPGSILFLTGLTLESVHVNELLTRLDAQPDLLHVGKYKSAAETFTRKSPSRYAKQMLNDLADGTYDALLSDVAKYRGMTVDALKTLIDRGPYTPGEARDAGLIDAVDYAESVRADVKKSLGSARLIPLARHHRVRHARAAAAAYVANEPRVAVLTAAGAIVDKASSGAIQVPQREFCRAIDALRRNKRVGAVVLRVASPGGSGTASDLIHRELTRLAKKKPLVVAFGDVAASGGYYIGCVGRPIYSEGATMTGSIGVISGKFVLRGLYKKIGIAKEIVARGAHAAIFSEYTPFSATERQKMQAINERFYELFKERVAASRGMPEADVETAAQGRVFVGKPALGFKLVDRAGGLWEAVVEAARLAGADPAKMPRVEQVEYLRAPLLRAGGLLGVDAFFPAVDVELASLAALFTGETLALSLVVPKANGALPW